MKTALLLLLGLAGLFTPLSAQESSTTKYYLIGNSLTWDTVPSKLDGDVQWHVGCGKSLPFLFENPEAPCVKSSTIWPKALQEKQYDIISVQSHYGSTLEEDAVVISEWMRMQPKAVFVIHTGWARSAERVTEWNSTESGGAMKHSKAYIEALTSLLKKNHPDREIRRTYAMDLLQQIAEDIDSGKAPIGEVAELYRDKIHMNVVTGRYLMHNAMRHALGQPRSIEGFAKIEPQMKAYLDSVLDTLDEDNSGNKE